MCLNMCIYDIMINMYQHNLIYKINFIHELNIYLHNLVLSLSPDNNDTSNILIVGLQGPIPLCFPIQSCYVIASL